MAGEAGCRPWRPTGATAATALDFSPCPTLQSSPTAVVVPIASLRTPVTPVVGVGPWRLSAAPEVAWQAVRELVAATPRTTIVKEEPWYLRAEARSRLLRFVDDLELALDPEQGLLSVRSASRVGYSDRGVNRRRVERLRSLLAERQVIESPVIES